MLKNFVKYFCLYENSKEKMGKLEIDYSLLQRKLTEKKGEIKKLNEEIVKLQTKDAMRQDFICKFGMLIICSWHVS